MRNRKFGWILAVILVMALLLAGCGDKAEPETGKVAPLPEETQSETKAPETGKVEAPPEEPEPPAEPEETEAPEENPLTLGRMEGGTYTNAYAGIACDLDESWTFYSAEELQTIPDSVKEAVEGSDVSELMEDGTQLMDMMAENVELMATMNVLYGSQDMASRLAAQTMTEEEFIDVTLEQQDMMKEAYTQMGMTDISMEKVSVTVLGEEHWALKTTAKTQDVDYYILQLFNYKAGAYSVTLTCSSFVEDQTQTLLDLFYPAE